MSELSSVVGHPAGVGENSHIWDQKCQRYFCSIPSIVCHVNDNNGVFFHSAAVEKLL